LTCEACTRAEHNPETGIYHADCMGCQARSVAQSPQAKARHADPQALLGLMRRIWVDKAEHAKGRPLMWEWLKRIEDWRERRE
jgi:hypothetical protein